MSEDMVERGKFRRHVLGEKSDAEMGLTFWNGEPCCARVVSVVVGRSPRKTWWCAKLEGQTRQVVEVDYHGEKFYLDNEDGSGWLKITEGRGSPAYAHSSVPVQKVLPV